MPGPIKIGEKSIDTLLEEISKNIELLKYLYENLRLYKKTKDIKYIYNIAQETSAIHTELTDNTNKIIKKGPAKYNKDKALQITQYFKQVCNETIGTNKPLPPLRRKPREGSVYINLEQRYKH